MNGLEEEKREENFITDVENGCVVRECCLWVISSVFHN